MTLRPAIHYPVHLTGMPEQSRRTGIPDSVCREKLASQATCGRPTTDENSIRSTGQASKPDVCMAVSSGVPEQVSVYGNSLIWKVQIILVKLCNFDLFYS